LFEAAAPATLIDARNVTLDVVVLHTFNVDITALLPAGTVYRSALVFATGKTCPRVLYFVAILFPYIPANKNELSDSVTVIVSMVCPLALVDVEILAPLPDIALKTLA
jgi:hypothetical protein